jgi:hypothetical protein
LLALLFVVIPAGASAEVTFCAKGSAAGQCEGPEGVAADNAAGHVYVADRKNNRIDVFDSTGSFLFAFGWGVKDGSSEMQECTSATGCQKGKAGSGAGELDRPNRIAIDNTADVLYVVDAGNARMQKFGMAGNFLGQFGSNGECLLSSSDPVAVGPTGSVYVAHEGYVGKFSEAGTCLEKVKLVEGPQFVRELAADSAGNLYASIAAAGGSLRKYSPTGTQLCAPDPGTETTAIGIAEAGNVLAAQRQGRAVAVGSFWVITEYNSACLPQRRFGYAQLVPGSIGAYPGLAPYHSGGGDVFASQEGTGLVHYLALPLPGPITPPATLEVPSATISNTKATFKAEINPEGKATQYHFEFISQEDYETQGNSFEGPATRSTPMQEVTATDFNLHGVQALAGCVEPTTAEPSTCLKPETEYRFRVVATNADGAGEGTAEGPAFETRSAVEIPTTFATEVGTDTAKLSAEVNPLGIPTTGYFEYVDDAHYQQSGFAEASKIPAVGNGAGELSFGFGEAPALRSATLYPLTPGLIYHYRVSVTDGLIAPLRVEGPERTVTTFKTPVSESCGANEAFRVGASALLGDCRAYELVSPLNKESGDVIALGEFTTETPSTLDQSSLGGEKLAYGSYRAFGDAESAPFTSQYVAERETDGWTSHAITPPRGRLVTEVTGTLDTEVKALSGDLCEAWLLTVADPPLAPGAVPGYRNLYRRQNGGGCGEKSYEALTLAAPSHIEPGHSLRLELQGLSADHSTVIYTANDNLEGTAAPDNPSGKEQLYERTPAGTSYVCILPGEVPTTLACSAGTNFIEIGSGQNRGTSVTNAISNDGQRVFWTAYQSAAKGPGQIYVRIGGDHTLAVSKEAEDESGTETSVFLGASENGARAFFLTGENLYEFEVNTEATTLVAEKVPGIMGASEDGSRIYLVSREVLSGSNGEGKSPVGGSPNLYLDEEGAFTFVGELSGEDVKPFPGKGESSPISRLPFERTSRLSSDGQFAVFMSFARLTGYENVDARNQEVDAEVYRYSVASEELRCISCNPTGARPAGSNIVRMASGGHLWAGGSIQGWENSLYASRNLSNGGSRVFFESSDVLSPFDSNGVEDVYQWEEAGTGRCKEESPSFSPVNGGCVSLISSGQSGRRSEFNDASPSGDNVFFSTLASLVSQDYGLVDVYDARVDGGFPSPPLPPAPCEGEACQHPAPTPEAQAPSSLGYVGPGNVVETAAKPKKCPKGRAKENGRCVKKKHPKKKQRKAGQHGRAGR